MVFSIPGATTCCRIRIARVVPRGYDPIVGELRRSDPYDDHYVPPPRHGLRAYGLSFQSGGGRIGSIHEKKKRERKKQRHMFNKFERRSFSAPLSATDRRQQEEDDEC